ncbi:hypothetical protein P3X46_023319 [Hevea brasiliensis]|uniref:Uncharacterized protein n=1 Tax=Hevea brasiliensis TaxID=3981 RepID=A0ABQ9LE91_HEVBR|nr:uncharacterized protein LOC110654351 [Hevea brasiliensis]XP_057988463.1 uncharacterized protein LOC110654351 [Hevea brasiliensis]KAJ9163677.1 hypothetical protein P3X46_023319 [Hevea brasiliensis]
MVAISLYRGNLHRVPDVPRRWPMPVRKISLKDFKSLLHRRSKALSRLRSSTNAIATTSNHNPKTDPKENVDPIALNLEAGEGTNREEEEGTSKGSASKEVKDQKGLDFGECSVKPEGLSDLSPAEKGDDEAVNADGNFQPEKLDLSANPNTEPRKADVVNDKEKRKKEVEEKLLVLNAKKHNLVQVLKQILNVEEELKRRNSMQGMGIRPSVPLQGDIANDSGSMSRHNTPRMGSEGNLGGDMEGGETEDVSNPSNHSRHIQRMSSTSPSSESPLRKPPYIQHNVVPYPSRPSLGTISSPSRFAPTGHQVPSANVPMVSVSGTNYIASSPSPAASGGTSAFRDARQPSPWN